MNYTFYDTASQEDFDRVVGEVVVGLDEQSDAQRSLTTITLDCEDLDRPELAEVVVTTREWIPEYRNPRHTIMNIPVRDVADLNINLPSERMLRLPPRKDGNEDPYWPRSAEPPFTKLHYNNDVVVASPEVMHILDAVQRETGLDIQAMVTDLEALYNRTEDALDLNVRRGLGALSGERSVVLAERQRLESRIHSLYGDIMRESPPPGWRLALGETIQDMIDELENGFIGRPTWLVERRLEIDSLVADYNRFLDAVSNTKDISRDVFVDAINSQGIGMPSIFRTPEEAVEEVGFANSTFLRI